MNPVAAINFDAFDKRLCSVVNFNAQKYYCFKILINEVFVSL